MLALAGFVALASRRRFSYSNRGAKLPAGRRRYDPLAMKNPGSGENNEMTVEHHEEGCHV